MSKYQKSYRRIVEGFKIMGVAAYVNLVCSTPNAQSLEIHKREPNYILSQTEAGFLFGLGKVIHSLTLMNYGRKKIQENKRFEESKEPKVTNRNLGSIFD